MFSQLIDFEMKVLRLLVGLFTIILITIAFCDCSAKGDDNQVQSESQYPIDAPDDDLHVNDYPIGLQDINGRNPYDRNWQPLYRDSSGPRFPCYPNYFSDGNQPFGRFNYDRSRSPNWFHLNNNHNNQWARDRQDGNSEYGPNSYGYEYSLPGGGYTYFHRYFRK